MNLVVRNIPRIDAATAEGLERLGVATVHEANGRKGLLAPAIRPIYQGARIAGTAVTVETGAGDNWMIHVAVEQCKAGDVLVVAPQSYSATGYFGDLLATALKLRGVKGLIIDGGTRDVGTLREMGFPVWSNGVFAQGPHKEKIGSVNVPIVVAGLVVRPGDAIVADDDGVVVVQREDAAAVLAAGRAREADEEKLRQRYLQGEISLDVLNMRGKLAEKGLTYIDFE
jgi:4-hydroxy-4-methyl-2-oxoglutarate aldolase